MDVYEPPARGSRAHLAPVLFYVHGGGFIVGDKAFSPRTLFATALRAGWLVVSCNYRLAPRVPLSEIVTDVKRALAWTKTEGCERFGGKASAVVCAGESAGGHLALMLTLTAHDKSYQPGFEAVDTSVSACVDLYGVHDLLDSSKYFAQRDKGAMIRFMARDVVQQPLDDAHKAQWLRYSPRDLLTATAPELVPPILGVHGAFDNLVPVPDARAFYSLLRQRRASAAAGAAPPRVADVYIELATAHHCFNWIPSPRTLAFDAAALAFMTAAVASL